MESAGKKYIVVLVLFAVSALVVNYLSYDAFGGKNDGFAAIGKIPYAVGEWQGKDLSLDPSVYELLETNTIIHRNYQRGHSSILLSVVYYPETKVDFHAPESCLGGKGIRTKSTVKQIQFNCNGNTVDLAINVMAREQDEDKQLIYYFYKAGHFVGSSYIKLRFAVAFNKFSSRKKSGSLIRVSTPVVQEDYSDASENLLEFIEELYPYIIYYL